MKEYKSAIFILSFSICFYALTNLFITEAASTPRTSPIPTPKRIHFDQQYGKSLNDLDKQVNQLKSMCQEITGQGRKVKISWTFTIDWDNQKTAKPNVPDLPIQ